MNSKGLSLLSPTFLGSINNANKHSMIYKMNHSKAFAAQTTEQIFLTAHFLTT